MAASVETVLEMHRRDLSQTAASSYPTALLHLALRDEEPSFMDALSYAKNNKNRFFKA